MVASRKMYILILSLIRTFKALEKLVAGERFRRSYTIYFAKLLSMVILHIKYN